MSGPAFRSVIGHREIIRHFQSAVLKNRISHAYLLTGETGIGKKTLAEALAALLVCDQPVGAGTTEGIDACGTCRSCLRAAGGNHPDIIHVGHEKPNVITVEEIRTQLVQTVDIRPYEGGRKIYIVPDAEKMNPQAQNAMLKTIEEPPEYAVILLLSNSQEAMLPTVLSRCVKIPVLPIPDRLVRGFLEREMQLPGYEARTLSALAQGNIGKAIRLLRDPEAEHRREEMIRIAAEAGSMRTGQMIDAVKMLREEKAHSDEMLDTLLTYYRDAGALKAGCGEDSVVYISHIEQTRKDARELTWEGLLQITEELERVRERLRSNVNPDLTFEVLLNVMRKARIKQ